MHNRSFLNICAILLMLGFNLLPTLAQQDPTLENTSWKLVSIHGFGDSEFIPSNPENYLLRFRLENRLQIEADCNQAGATWGLDGDSFTLRQLVTTRKLCIQPSLFNRYIMNLDQAAFLMLEGDRLIIKSASEVDWMEFEPYVLTPSF